MRQGKKQRNVCFHGEKVKDKRINLQSDTQRGRSTKQNKEKGRDNNCKSPSTKMHLAQKLLHIKISSPGKNGSRSKSLTTDIIY